ncbi:SRPBCC domain-containing protein [Parvibaculum sp.]|uniref:SRPBCC domain-containing protein n=1 Tax=Parvibaculum sp. TaxID=2024848 RepID=UPI0034A071CF
MSGKVAVAVRLAVDPAEAFRAFTEDVDLWWQRGIKFRFHPRKNGVMRFEPGEGGRLVEVYDEAAGDIYEVGRILVWQPGERLVFEWRAPNYREGQVTEVELRFQPVEGGTRILLEHRGWETLPGDHPARHGLADVPFLGTMGGWWQEQLAALKERL